MQTSYDHVHLDIRTAMDDELYTVADATIAHAGDHAGRARLIVYHGADSDAGTRMVEIPDGAEVTFGRSRSSTVHIDSERVSRNHARLVREGDRFTVEDLGSRNGTRVNGDKIEQSTRVSSGDEISIGSIMAVVSITSSMVRHRSIGSTTYLEERLAAEVDRGLQFQRRCALMMLRLHGSVAACDEALDQIVAMLRPMDVVAEYGPDDVALILPEATQQTARETARALVGVARQNGVRVYVGVALFPEHGTKPGVLLSGARAALRSAGQQDEPVALPPSEQEPRTSEFVVADPQMERVFALARKVADHPITVLINGETGVGKEVVAETIHRSSQRSDKPFVRLNCASIPETLLESELFGHEKGAFTGADRRKLGYFEAAGGGTIFLDEIGEIKGAVQSKLLRVLEAHKISRVGGTRSIDVDVRVVCATNRDLEAEVARGVFREDLFFRISAFTIVVPPLRDRPAEVSLLAQHFLRHAAREAGVAEPSLSEAADRAVCAYRWPGNVRELRNAMERAIVLHTGATVEIDDLPDRVRDTARADVVGPGGTGLRGDMRDQIADVERATIVGALDACGGNQTRAAKQLGLSRRALIYKMEKYGLKPPPSRRR
ncbi:MAG: sigma 54-interacting transcriptional regulator [Proteobacteria bacterium]|nr:sigma 54-interacting transcriptional regulator [Pseudomonadota bacterium]